MFIHDLCQTKDMVYHVVPWCTMLFHVSTSICCFQYLSLNSNYLLLLPWLIMVDHGLWTWLTMVDILPFQSQFDHGWPWSALCHLTFMVDHGQTMVRPWTNHGLPWLPTMKNHVQNMVDHGQTMILVPGEVHRFLQVFDLCNQGVTEEVWKVDQDLSCWRSTNWSSVSATTSRQFFNQFSCHLRLVIPGPFQKFSFPVSTRTKLWV